MSDAFEKLAPMGAADHVAIGGYDCCGGGGNPDCCKRPGPTPCPVCGDPYQGRCRCRKVACPDCGELVFLNAAGTGPATHCCAPTPAAFDRAHEADLFLNALARFMNTRHREAYAAGQADLARVSQAVLADALDFIECAPIAPGPYAEARPRQIQQLGGVIDQHSAALAGG